MAKAKVETNNEWLDARPEDFSQVVRDALAAERAAYEVLKARKAEVLVAVRVETPMPAGREIKSTAYTRWGQWQLVIGDVAAPKEANTQRKSLADFLAAQAACGRRA